MRNFLRSSPLWLALLLVISCQKNNETPTATMTFLNDGRDNYASEWVVISDQSGKVLTWKSLPVNVSTSLTYPSGKDSVNLTIIRKANNNFFALSTYTNVAAGSYSSPAPFQNPAVLGTYKVQCLSPTDYYYFLPNSECGWTQNADNTEYQVNVCANSSLFLSMSKFGALAPRYLYNPQINANGSVAIDQTMYNSLPEMKSKNVALGDTYASGFMSLNVIKDWSPQWIYISYTFSNNTNSQLLYYPDQIGSAFDEYFVVSALSKPNIAFTSTSTVKDPSNYSVPTFTPTLDAVTSATTSNLDYTLSGSADYVYTFFNSSTSVWSIYNSFSKKISTTLPVFPDDLKKEVDFSFITTLQMQSITIEESDLGGYTSFYSNSIVGGGKTSKNTRSKQYTPKADGSIGGGG